MIKRRQVWLAVAALAGVLGACRSDFSAVCAVGTEDCPCTPNGGCDPGLECLSNTCVSGDAETSDTAAEGSTQEESGSGESSGDGDGDASGDGDSSGDGDGDSSGDGDGDSSGDGDGDGDSSGDGDGDGDSSGDGDGDGDSACFTCATGPGACANQTVVDACVADSDCVCVLNCTGVDGTWNECLEVCGLGGSPMPASVAQMQWCANDQCPDDCGGVLVDTGACYACGETQGCFTTQGSICMNDEYCACAALCDAASDDDDWASCLSTCEPAASYAQIAITQGCLSGAGCDGPCNLGDDSCHTCTLEGGLGEECEQQCFQDPACACVSQCERFGGGTWDECTVNCGAEDNESTLNTEACLAGVGMFQTGVVCVDECSLTLGSACQTCLDTASPDDVTACVGDDTCVCVLACMSFPDSGNPTPTIDSCMGSCGAQANPAFDALLASGDPSCVDTCGYPDLIWERTHNGTASDEDRARGVDTDASGSIYVVGTVREFASAEKANVWMRKYGSDGSVTWTQKYDAPDVGDFDNDEGYAVSYDPDSDEVVFAGSTNLSEVTMGYFSSRSASTGLEVWGGATANPDNAIYWTRNFGVAAGKQEAGALVVGDYYNQPQNQEEDALARLVVNPGGGGITITAQQTYAETALQLVDRFNAADGVVTNSDGIAYVAVGKASTGATGGDILIAMFDINSNIIDSATLDISGLEDEALCVDARYNSMSGEVEVIVGGFSETPGEGQNYWVRRLASTASGVVWTKSWDESSSGEQLSGCAFDADGNVIVGGVWSMYKFDATTAGNPVWTRQTNGADIHALTTDSDGNIIVAGQRNDDIWVAKYRP